MTPQDKLKLQMERDKLVLSKKEHERQMALIKDKVVGNHTLGRTLDPPQLEACRRGQESHRAALIVIERRLSVIKGELRKEAIERWEEVGPEESRLIHKLSELRLEYQRFAADGTRVGSMRTMAAEFALKLDDIIKESIRIARDQEAMVLRVAK